MKGSDPVVPNAGAAESTTSGPPLCADESKTASDGNSLAEAGSGVTPSQQLEAALEALALPKTVRVAILAMVKTAGKT